MCIAKNASSRRCKPLLKALIRVTIAERSLGGNLMAGCAVRHGNHHDTMESIPDLHMIVHINLDTLISLH